MELSTSMIEIDKTVLYSSAGLLAGWLLSEFKQILLIDVRIAKLLVLCSQICWKYRVEKSGSE